MRRALFLAPEAPYPMAGGGAMRSASVLECLARHFEVDAIVFREPGSPPPSFPSGRIRDLAVIDLPRNSRHAFARALRNSARMIRGAPPLLDRFAGFGEAISRFLAGRAYSLGVIEHFWCAPYWERVAPCCERVALDLHNVESAWHERSGEAAGGPRSLAHGVFRRASLDLEKRWLPCFSLLLAASEEDAGRVRQAAPAARVVVYPNAIPLVEQPRPAEEDLIVFSGSLDYDPNRAAVRFFRRDIWPRLRERWPRLRWRLVGRNPHAVKTYIDGDPRIECSGPIDNPLEELAPAKVAVVPLLAGSGTRLKIVEAWAAGRAVVSTTLGAEGLPARRDENILIEDHPVRFAEAVSALLDSPGLRGRIGQCGRATYERELTWEAAWRRLDPELNP